MGMDVLLRIGDGSTDGVLGSLASFRQRIVSGIEILPVLHIARRQYTLGAAMQVSRRTFCIFVKTFL